MLNNSYAPFILDLYRGFRSELLDGYQVGFDPVWGAYMDNTSSHTVMATELEAAISPTDTPGPTPTFTLTPTPGVTPSDFIYLPLTEK